MLAFHQSLVVSQVSGPYIFNHLEFLSNVETIKQPHTGYLLPVFFKGQGTNIFKAFCPPCYFELLLISL